MCKLTDKKPYLARESFVVYKVVRKHYKDPEGMFRSAYLPEQRCELDGPGAERFAGRRTPLSWDDAYRIASEQGGLPEDHYYHSMGDDMTYTVGRKSKSKRGPGIGVYTRLKDAMAERFGGKTIIECLVRPGAVLRPIEDIYERDCLAIDKIEVLREIRPDVALDLIKQTGRKTY